jgi:hypothetical protein
MKAERAIPQSYSVFVKILESNLDRKRKVPGSFIENSEQKHQLKALFFNELQKYKKTVEQLKPSEAQEGIFRNAIFNLFYSWSIYSCSTYLYSIELFTILIICQFLDTFY